MQSELNFVKQCTLYLEETWTRIQELSNRGEDEPLHIELAELKELILDCLTSRIKTYHYVLPTQLLCKCVDSSLDCRSLQVAYNRPGAFDARSVAHAVLVPFDRANHRVLGGSPEPYVNNPLRYPAIIAQYRDQQKNQKDWDKLVRVLNTVEEANDENFTEAVFEQVLVEIHKLLAGAVVKYPLPQRISLDQTKYLVEAFLAEKSGGDRTETVCTALFQTIADRFGIFDEVYREKINVADASSGMLADIECYADEEVALLVEVKGLYLTFTQLDSTLDRARTQRIREILFLTEQDIEKGDEERARGRIRREFASGQNVYVTNFFDFAHGILILFGEAGRIRFLENVGAELNRANSAIQHRRAWSDLLRQI